MNEPYETTQKRLSITFVFDGNLPNSFDVKLTPCCPYHRWFHEPLWDWTQRTSSRFLLVHAPFSCTPRHRGRASSRSPWRQNGASHFTGPLRRHVIKILHLIHPKWYHNARDCSILASWTFSMFLWSYWYCSNNIWPCLINVLLFWPRDIRLADIGNRNA